MKKLLLAFPIIALLAAGCNASQQAVSQTPVPTPVAQNTNPTPTPSPTPAATKTPSAPPANTGTITLDAATKVAVVQAIMNSFDILASNDPAKIRIYYLTELQTPDQVAQFKTMSDSQLLQVAAAAVANAGKPSASLATDPAATWKLDGKTVTITTKGYAKPNPAYPATANLTVTYQAVYINGAWY